MALFNDIKILTAGRLATVFFSLSLAALSIQLHILHYHKYNNRYFVQFKTELPKMIDPSTCSQLWSVDEVKSTK